MTSVARHHQELHPSSLTLTETDSATVKSVLLEEMGEKVMCVPSNDRILFLEISVLRPEIGLLFPLFK